MEEERGVSFGDILKMLKKHIIWILIVSVVAAVAAGLLVGLVFNKNKVTYSMSFMLQYPNSEQKLMPDGTPLYYETIIYSENLKKAKESNEKFSSIDINGMMSENGIRIKERSVQAEGTEQGIRYTGVYDISADGIYFKDVGQASEFLKALTDVTIQNILDKVGTERYSATISSFENLTSYSEQIDCLVAQRDFLLARYSALSSRYGDRMVDGKTLDSYSADVAIVLSNETVSRLRKDLSNNRYLLTETVKDILVSIDSYNIEKEKNDSAIKSLENELDELYKKYPNAAVITDSFETFHTRIAYYIERNAEISIEISRLYHSIGYVFDEETQEWTKKATEVDSSIFDAELKSFYTKLNNQTEICKRVIDKFYSDESRAVFGQDEASAVNDGQSVLTMTVLAFVAAFVVAAVIACFIEYPKYTKAHAVLQTPSAKEEEKKEDETEE